MLGTQYEVNPLNVLAKVMKCPYNRGKLFFSGTVVPIRGDERLRTITKSEPLLLFLIGGAGIDLLLL